MQELDLLLTRYLDEQYDLSGDKEKLAFHSFLELSDPEINSYLFGGITPSDLIIAGIVSRIVCRKNSDTG
ncbi:MAG: hypothetical protein CMO98_11790 [Woeseia sp.]|nr:hypothetical protein [Woeseia sp.]|tara:strand:- start:1316 stop:1525 length:210 start_codon:yes stop_codon:yes gene_type:complete